MGRLEDEISRLEAEVEGLLSDPDPDRVLREHQARDRAEHERLTQLIEALETGGDTSAYDPEEVEEIRAVMEDIRPVLRELAEEGAIQRPRSPNSEDEGEFDLDRGQGEAQ